MDRRAVIRKLQKGKEAATRLQTLLRQKTCGERRSALAAELTLEIESSFTDTIHVLSSYEIINGLSPQIAPVADGAKLASPVDRSSSRGSDHGKKRAGGKDRRGCYSRRNSAKAKVVTCHTTEDGYAWRKYGQKDILNTKFPRCYFRCTHKHDQSCKATRQVQRVRDDPALYQITYFGSHSCKNMLMRTPQIITEIDSMESCYLSFETTKATIAAPASSSYTPMFSPSVVQQQQQPPPPPPPNHHNQELKDETQSSDVTFDNKSSCLGSSMWQHESSAAAHRSPNQDQEANSAFQSCSSTPLPELDMDAFVGTKFGDFDNDLYMVDDLGFNLQFNN